MNLPATKHIVFLCSRLDLPGGIERAVVNTANLFASKGNQTTLLILDHPHKSFYPINERIQVLQQSLSFGITPEGNIVSRKITLISDVLKLRRLLKHLQPTLVIATEYPFAAASILSGVNKWTQVISWEHHHHAWLEKNRFWTWLCKQTYTRLNGIVCLNKEEASHYETIAPTFIVPNFVENLSGKKSASTNKIILSVGWLIHRKGIDLLLKTAKEVLHKHPDWIWKLIGMGEMKEEVIQFIQINELNGRLLLQSPSDSEITQEYINASLYVLSSRYEAFPMVLLEALSFGVPCISFNCSSGPSDIITDSEDGVLVETGNTQQLSTAISSLISNEELRKKMGEKAVLNVQRFSPENIYTLWEQVF